MVKINLDRFMNSSRIGVGVGLFLGQILPPPIGHKIADCGAKLVACRRSSKLVQGIRLNQWVVRGGNSSGAELNRAVTAVLKSTARALYDFFHFYNNPDQIRELVEFTPVFRELFNERMKYQRGMLFVAPHLGSFDLAGANLSVRGLKFQVLSYPTPTSSYRLQNQMREKLGIHMTPFTVEALQEARKRLQEGGTVLTGLDRPWEESNYRPRFFGRPAALPVAYIQLAMRSGVPVSVVATYRKPDGQYCLDCTDPVTMITTKDRESDIVENAEKVLSFAEKFIRKYPDQWSMFYPIWPDAREEMITKKEQ